jgi:hypothetical protein
MTSEDRFNRSYPFIERRVGPKFTLTFDYNLPPTNKVDMFSITDSGEIVFVTDAGGSTKTPTDRDGETDDEVLG